MEDLLDTSLLSYMNIKDNIIAWKSTQSLFIYDIDKRIHLNIMNIPPLTYRLVMFLCILNDHDLLYYMPAKIYYYDYIERAQKEYEIDKSIFPL